MKYIKNVLMFALLISPAFLAPLEAAHLQHNHTYQSGK